MPPLPQPSPDLSNPWGYLYYLIYSILSVVLFVGQFIWPFLVLLVLVRIIFPLAIKYLRRRRTRQQRSKQDTIKYQRTFEVSDVNSNFKSALPYRHKDYLLSVAECSFYDILMPIANRMNMQVFPKVRLVDLVLLPKGTAQRQTHFNRVVSKHVDFVLCHQGTISPALVIELDDWSHDLEERHERDRFVDAVLEAAELPVLHIRGKQYFDPGILSKLINDALEQKQAAIPNGAK